MTIDDKFIILLCPTGIPSLGKKPSKLKGAGPAIEKKKLTVETDVNKLVNYVCGTCLTKTGEDVKLKEDSEYPEWLWTLNTGMCLSDCWSD